MLARVFGPWGGHACATPFIAPACFDTCMLIDPCLYVCMCVCFVYMRVLRPFWLKLVALSVMGCFACPVSCRICQLVSL